MTSLAPPRPPLIGRGHTGPPFIEGWDGGGWGWVSLTRARNDIEASLVTGRLEGSGIETSTLKDRSAPGSFLYCGSDASAPVTILVRKIQYEDARLILAEVAFDAPPALREEFEPSTGWRGPVLWWVAALMLGAFFTALSYVEATNRLEQCRGPACPVVDREAVDSTGR